MCWKIYKKQNEAQKADAMFKDLEKLYKNNHEHSKKLIETYNLSISFEESGQKSPGIKQESFAANLQAS